MVPHYVFQCSIKLLYSNSFSLIKYLIQLHSIFLQVFLKLTSINFIKFTTSINPKLLCFSFTVNHYLFKCFCDRCPSFTFYWNAHAYLLKISMIVKRYFIPLLNLEKEAMSAKTADRTLSILTIMTGLF